MSADQKLWVPEAPPKRKFTWKSYDGRPRSVEADSVVFEATHVVFQSIENGAYRIVLAVVSSDVHGLEEEAPEAAE